MGMRGNGDKPVQPILVDAEVRCADGAVGRVDEFLLDPSSGNITHLVMRKGHLWGKRDVSIPVSAIREAHDDAVFLALNKQQVGTLPAILIHRQWVEGS